MIGARKPRICVVPDGDEHPRWGEMLDVLSRLEMDLDPWQRDILHASLLRRGDIWAAFTVAICCPRQNGKNMILMARELLGALVLGEQLIIHSAHLADTCMEHFTDLDNLIDGNDWLLGQIDYVRRTNGRELVKFHNGSRIRFRTRTRGGGRGFSGSPVIFDEPMFFPVISQNAIVPVMSAQPDPQAWYTGSAVDQLEHEDGIAFARVRERALSGEDDRLVYFEWSLDYGSPDELPADVAYTEAAVAATNPSYGIRITPDYIRAERLELTPRGGAVERHGVGDWPRTDNLIDYPFDPVAWGDLEEGQITGERCISFDVSPSRRTSVVEVGMSGTALCVGVLASRDGTDWVPQFLQELVESGDVVEIVCDGYGPAGSVATVMRELGVPIRLLDANDHAQACGMFVDKITENGLRLANREELDAAVLGAKTRPLVDSWAWSRRNSKVDISPLVAATLAVFSAIDVDIANREELVIY